MRSVDGPAGPGNRLARRFAGLDWVRLGHTAALPPRLASPSPAPAAMPLTLPPDAPTVPDAAAADAARFGRPLGGWRLRLYVIIFEADTRAGRLFDLALIWLILASVAVVVLDSFPACTRAGAGLQRPRVVLHAALHARVRRPPRLRAPAVALRPQPVRHHRRDRRAADLARAVRARPARADRRAAAAAAPAVPDPAPRPVRPRVPGARPCAAREPAQDPRLPELRADRHRRHGHRDVRGRGAGERLYQHPGLGVLGDHDDDHGRLRRHHAQDRARPDDRLADDAGRLGHARGADRHRQRRVHGAAHGRECRRRAPARRASRKGTRRRRDSARTAAPSCRPTRGASPSRTERRCRCNRACASAPRPTGRGSRSPRSAAARRWCARRTG